MQSPGGLIYMNRHISIAIKKQPACFSPWPTVGLMGKVSTNAMEGR